MCYYKIKQKRPKFPKLLFSCRCALGIYTTQRVAARHKLSVFRQPNFTKEVFFLEFKLKKFDIAIEVTRIANIHYFEFTKDYHTFGDSHEFCELVYVDAGAIRVESEGFCGVLQKNEMIIHTAGEIHSLRCEDSGSPNVIIIGFECHCPELFKFSTSPCELNAEQGRLLSDVIREGRAVFMPPYDLPNLKDMKTRRDYPFGADQLIKLKLECFLISLIRSREMKSKDKSLVLADSKMREIHDYLTENFRENITLEELSFLFGTNKTTLCKTFKAAFGTSIISYVNSLKIKEARRLIRDGAVNITQISDELGFSSIHYFSRLFKKTMGISPMEYIKTLRAKLGE